MRMPIKVLELCKAKSGTGTGVPVNCKLTSANKSFQLTSTGTTTAVIQVSNDNTNFIDYLQLSCTSTTSDGHVDICPWPYIRVNVTANTGEATMTMGC